MRFLNILLWAISLFLISCNNNQNDKKPDIDPTQYKKDLEKANILLTHSEDAQIEDYIFRKSWKMNQTKTGLRYWIYKKTDEKKIEGNPVVRFNYRVELINGFVCYNSDEDGYKEVMLGHSDLPIGIDEGIKMMRVGEKAKFILPSHLAYGLLGDQNKIPTRAVLIYDIEILDIIK